MKKLLNVISPCIRIISFHRFGKFLYRIQAILIFLSFILFYSQPMSAQWVQQNSGFNQFIGKIRFINRYTGWMCGDAGFISKTTNSGVNWIQQNNPASDKLLTTIFPANENIVYCVGYFETILKTTNSGLNWIALSNGPIGQGNSNFGVYFLNTQTGWIISALGRVLKTTNGGISFDTLSTGGAYLRDVYFKDSNTGLICGEVAQMFKSTNGGTSWYFISIPVGTQSADFLNLTFINNQYGWVVGRTNNKVYKTTNFGDSWDSLVRIQNMTFSNSIFFSSINTGWVAGQYISAGGFPRVYKSTNGGQNWNLENLQFSSYGHLMTSWFYNDSVGWVAGGSGQIFHTSNSGLPAGISRINRELPVKYLLHQNYPNPFNGETVIEFEIPNSSAVSIKLYDVLGKLIDIVLEQYISPGRYRINYNATALISGSYFCQFIAGTTVITRKLVLIK